MLFRSLKMTCNTWFCPILQQFDKKKICCYRQMVVNLYLYAFIYQPATSLSTPPCSYILCALYQIHLPHRCVSRLVFSAPFVGPFVTLFFNGQDPHRTTTEQALFGGGVFKRFNITAGLRIVHQPKYLANSVPWPLMKD